MILFEQFGHDPQSLTSSHMEIHDPPPYFLAPPTPTRHLINERSLKLFSLALSSPHN